MNEGVLRNKTLSLPSGSGVYLFRELKNKPLYIGKALNLKNRVKNYLKTNDTRLKKMISKSKRVDYIETRSDIEALILESQLIKKHRPFFNIVLRDDKQYSFVVFTEENCPKIFTTHQPHVFKYLNIEISNSVGPFTDGGALKTTLQFLRRIFPYCTCRQLHNNYCLNYHIGKCPGFCCLKDGSQKTADKKMVYMSNVKAIRDILSGKKVSLIKSLKKEMGQLAKSGELEKAIELRNKIVSLERIFENAKIIKNSDILKEHHSRLESLLKLKKPIIRIEGYDVSNIQGAHATGSTVTFVNGLPDKNFYRKFKIQTKQTPDDIAMLKEILERRFRHTEWPFPDLILVDGGKGQVNTAIKTLKKLAIKIPVVGISKNERHIGHRLIIPGRKTPLPLTNPSPADRNLLLQIDSEAHRFAIGYYRKIHRQILKKLL